MCTKVTNTHYRKLRDMNVWGGDLRGQTPPYYEL